MPFMRHELAFVDTEVNPQSQDIADFGAARMDGAQLHTSFLHEFESFLSGCTALCGHNIIRHDIKYLSQQSHTTPGFWSRFLLIDTLPLSPLLFPKKPYHRLVKDDKLQTDQLNNPLNDALKASDLFFDEVAAWKQLSPSRQTIYYHLLRETEEFSGFFQYLDIQLPPQDLYALILHEYQGKLCSHANLSAVIRHYPIELAYALAVIGADDIMSMTPAWVMRNYPKVANVMNLLRNTPCGNCEYCHSRLDAHQGLKDFFGFDHFRTFDGIPMQQQAVEAAIRGESLLTIFPTGGGKSLTFQLPALMAGRNTHGLTVVISPLLSLMKDQVDNLSERGISDAVAINGLLDPIERAEAINQVAIGAANLLYIAPEMLRSATIQRLLMGRNIVRFVIDEAHCFSAWGHDFRVDYLYIGDFLKQLQEKKSQQKSIAVSCFTATAKQKVISDISDYFQQKLGLHLKIFAASSERKNLRYSVIHADTDYDKYNLMRNIIIGHPCPTIVYVSRTKRTYRLSERLAADGISALPFNGKMTPEDKVRNQNAFMGGQVQVIVATSAFGMGVDKKDVGLVIHFDISDSLENYVQEAGRAGRDPETEAECYVLFSDNDLDKHFILLNQTKLSISEIQQVWRVIKDLTVKHTQISCSPLEIARLAGWGEETNEVDTHVKAAIAALEEAGFIRRGNNVPHIFATGIKVSNMDEARLRLTRSPFFDQNNIEEAARIIRSLISCRATSGNLDGEAESRIDYLADILGMSKETVIRNVNLMRQEGLLADSRDMQAWIVKSTTARELEQTLRLERFLLSQLAPDISIFNYKELNEAALASGLTNSTVRRIKTLFYFHALKGYFRKEEHAASDNVKIQLQTDLPNLTARLELRADICRFIVSELTATIQLAKKEAADTKLPAQNSTLVNFSIVGLLQKYLQNSQTLQFDQRQSPTLTDFEEALLYLSKTSLLKIEGGFLVIYNTLQLNRTVERRAQYGKEQYRLLDAFYKQRIRQIHIVGEYANLMVRDYNAALQFVSDYFQMDFRQFISKYFKGERLSEIDRNISPAKYQQVFGVLDDTQRKIIDDKQSKYIVVAAGPGSGKTRVLVHKLASLLLLEDVKHEQLLMLTFSRSAATEFKKRLIELIGNAAFFVEIKTFHSYCFDLVGKQGNLNDAKDIVKQAAAMIENGEVEESKIAKSVLVIDEAQDMGADDYRLVQALMLRNEEMRVIAVGDDDQNIYAFRGSDSAHLRSLVTHHGATLYEMTTNYRSAPAIVSLANRFASLIPNRMKCTPCVPFSQEDEGLVQVHRYDAPNLIAEFVNTVLPACPSSGTVCMLTNTNEEALQLSFLLQQKGLHTKLIQSLGDFRFYQLAEVRYFLKHLSSDTDASISREQWTHAKELTLKKYATSNCVDIMQTFFSDYEKTHSHLYYSDLKEYLYESNIEDFIASESETIFISTIHKAKGREFDTLHLVVPQIPNPDDEALRTLYVGITRAKQRLYIHTHNNPLCQMAQPIPHHVLPADNIPLCIPLTLRDVKLYYCKDKKSLILQLRSGEKLHYSHNHLCTLRGDCIASLSDSRRESLKELEGKGYQATSAEVSYVVAWHSKEDQQEYAICLASLLLSPTPKQANQ